MAAENVPDFSESIKHNRKEHVAKLNAAKEFVSRVSKTHDIQRIKIHNGVIITTNPERWDAHLKALAREVKE